LKRGIEGRGIGDDPKLPKVERMSKFQLLWGRLNDLMGE
jgi:hypothetical protein